jgi:Protein of unknown function (DUF3037)
VWYSYALVRVVPRVERGEYVNAGVVLFARQLDFLEARVELDAARLRALAPDADVELVERHLRGFEAVAAGSAEGGPVAALPPSERFHWLTSPRSTIIQTSPSHTGRAADPAAALDELLRRYVRLHAPAPKGAQEAPR